MRWFIGGLIVLALCDVAGAQTTKPTTKPVVFQIDAKRDVHPISRYIYGINQFHLFQDGLNGPFSNLTFTRLGGNRFSAYNWTNNASNAGADYHYESDNYVVMGDMYKGFADLPGGVNIPIAKIASDHNAAFMITIPMIGYVAADMMPGPNDVTTMPSFLSLHFKRGEPRKGAPFTLKPDPNDPVVYQDEYVNWVKETFPYGFTDPKRPIWFTLDNEPDWWSHKHKTVHPEPITYAEMMEKTIAYASAAKDVIPNAVIFGPANYAWQGFVTLQNAKDANNRDFQEFYLAELAKYEKEHGRRLIDVFDIHWYPENRSANNIRITMGSGEADGSPPVAAARVQAPRSLWDPTYKEATWIVEKSLHAPITLIPRMKKKIADNYPGTKFCISEYNFGGGADISGGIAQADVLGIFGREDLFAAALWAGKNIPYFGGAFEMYRNFDGKNGTFGDTSIHAETNNVEASSIYASLDSADPNRMVLVAINKTDEPLEVTIKLNSDIHFTKADVYQLTAAAPDPKPAGSKEIPDPRNLAYTMPPFSVSTLNLSVK